MCILAEVCHAHSNSDWLDLLKTTGASLVLPLSLTTFWLGYRQKEKERSKSYYHKIVVDVVLEPILNFFSTHIPNLQEAAVGAIRGMKGARVAIPKTSTERLARFSTELFDLQDMVIARTSVFDTVATNHLERQFQDLQDQVSEWFDDVGMHKRREPEGLEMVIMNGQRELVKQILEGKFRNYSGT